MREQAESMHSLFRGFEHGHGTYGREERSAGRKKSEIKKTARTLRDPVTVDLWLEHLEGRRPLGVIPVTEASECWWGVIDVDMYDLQHSDIAQNLEKLGMPLLVCRSKSGGAHLFVFLSTPVPAIDMINKLHEIAAALGYGGSEIFPKQVEVLLDSGQVGNWLNMPYYQADGGTRYCVGTDGRGLSIERFVDRAMRQRLTPEQFMDLKPAQVRAATSEGGDLDEGPPCLQHLASIGVGEGGRNNALFAFGTLAKKKFPDSWETKVDEWNQRYLAPPLTSDEVSIVKKGLRKKDYNYKCKDQPIASYCDSQACRGRRFGVGSGAAPGISTIQILATEPPLFFVGLTDGGTVECTSDDLLTPRAFQRTVLMQMRILLPLYKQGDWLSAVQACLDKAVVIEAPREVSIEGTFHDYLTSFVTDRHRAMERDEILLGKPYLDEESGTFMFRLADFMDYLSRVKFNDYSRPKVITKIRGIGGTSKFFNLKGRGTNLWMVQADRFEQQTEAHSVPRSMETPI